MTVELYRAELEVVLRDRNHNIGYGHAPATLDDVIREFDGEIRFRPDGTKLLVLVLAPPSEVDPVLPEDWRLDEA